jgi:ABC-type glycerol-3-phosphate transport system permease component
MKAFFPHRHTPTKEKITPVIVFDRILRVVLWLAMIVYCLSLLVLPIWMILTSFRGILEYNSQPFAWPESWNWSNYADAYKNLGVTIIKGTSKTEYSMLDLAAFSFIWSAAASFIGVATTTMVAYVIAKYKFPGRNFLFNLGIVIMIVPIIGALPAAMQVRKALGIYDNMVLMLITGPATAFSGLNFLLLYGIFKNMPWDYAEAIFIDGGGHFSAFFHAYLPMALPTCTVLFVLSFLGCWNDYATFMLWMPSTPNLAYGLYLFQQNAAGVANSSVPVVMAGFAMALLPSIVLYLLSQRLILSKFNVGGLKG